MGPKQGLPQLHPRWIQWSNLKASGFLAFFPPKKRDNLRGQQGLKVLLTASGTRIRPAYATLCKPRFHPLGQPYLHQEGCDQELKRFRKFLTMRTKNQTTFHLVKTESWFPTLFLYLKTQSTSQANLGLFTEPGIGISLLTVP